MILRRMYILRGNTQTLSTTQGSKPATVLVWSSWTSLQIRHFEFPSFKSSSKSLRFPGPPPPNIWLPVVMV